jgi:hypothetical protein
MTKKLTAILVLGLLAAILPAARGWSRSPLPVPHDKHAAVDLACIDCHKAAPEKEDLKTPIGFDRATCDGCHTAEDLQKFGYATPAARQAGIAGFSHRGHLSTGQKCEDCHGALVDASLVGTGRGEPGHAVCFDCHDGETHPNACEFCHRGINEGRLAALDRDPGAMKPMSHHPGFIHDHEFQVRLDGKSCADCHRQEDFCSTCHQGENLDYLVHPKNWDYEHPVAARKNLPDCSACHDRGTFCTECHIAEGVKPENHSAASWATGVYLHAQAARRDPALCAGCHDSEDLFICKRCHGVGADGAGTSPHGPDFKSNVGHGYWHDECESKTGACFDCHRNDPKFCGRCHERRECQGGD